MMDADRFQYVYRKYLTGQATPAEFEEIKAYFADKITIDELMQLDDIDALSPKAKPLDPQRSAAILKAVIASRPPKKSGYRLRYINYAAIAAGVLLVLFLGLHRYKQAQTTLPIFVNNTKSMQSYPLPDGSTLYLRPNAMVQQLSSFDQHDSTRRLRLSGEGFFAVHKNTAQPFIVESVDGVAVRVLGTRFLVNFQKNEASVMLTEGKVAVQAAQRQILLQPAERLIYRKNSREVHLQKVDTLIYNAWMENQLYFKEQSLHQVLRQLQKNYPDENIHLLPSQRHLKFTGFLPTDDLDQAIEILQRTFANHYLKITQYK